MKSNQVIAYRCPFCGKGVISNEGVLTLTAERMALRCPCKCSELQIEFKSDEKIGLKVPCIFCPTPHTYSLSKASYEERDILTLTCPVSGSATVFIGELNHVKAELSRTELELLDAMSENGIENFEELQKKENFVDSQIVENIIFVAKDLYDEGKIRCKCQNRDYEIEVTDEGVKVSCTECGASRTIPCDSYLAAEAFMEADELVLE